MTTTHAIAPTLGQSHDHHHDDILAIRALLAGVQAGVTAKDPDLCVARFSEDVRSVTAAGVRAAGRDAVRAAHVEAFAGALATTVPRFEVLDIVFLHSDVAVATTGAWAVSSSGDDVDLDRPASVVVYVLTRAADAWWVASRQFTKVAA